MRETTFSTRDSTSIGPSATARLIALIAAVVGVFVCTGPYVLISAWLVVLVPLHVLTRTARPLGYAVAIAVLPIGIMAFFVWGFLVGAPPGLPVGSDPRGGMEFGTMIGFRVAVLASITQLCLLTIPTDQLAVTFRRFGLRGEALVVILVSYTIIPELRLRMSQVITARTARGLRGTSILARVRDLTSMMLPVVAWTLRAAVQRADTWHHRKLLGRIEELANMRQETSAVQSGLVVILAGGWLVTTVIMRVAN